MDNPSDPSQSLAKRSITSLGWNAASQVVTIAAGFVRSWLLARWLPVETFGVYGFAVSVVYLSSIIPEFGMAGAFLHRDPATADEDEAAAVHFTLKAITTLAWATLMAASAALFFDGGRRTALLVLTAAVTGLHLAQTPRLILRRRVLLRRLAVLSIADSVLTAIVALGIALRGATLWALLATNVISAVMHITLLYVWRPVWRPRLAWSPKIVRYYLSFGGTNFLSTMLSEALDRIDDLWTAIFLGDTLLGFYDRAYTFATYPRAILANPIADVVFGTYAELKGARKRLSAAFYHSNALLIRSGFYLAGLIALAAPEFIRIVLGVKWLPMLDAFRLMLIFTLLDPLKKTIGTLFVAVGRPDQVAKVQVFQLIVMVAGLFGLGLPLSIAGVALAVDIMLLTGIVALLWLARAYVDYSVVRMFGAPSLALAVSYLLAGLASTIPQITASDWLSAGVKVVVFTGSYAAVLGLMERDQISLFRSLIKRHIFSRPAADQLAHSEKAHD